MRNKRRLSALRRAPWALPFAPPPEASTSPVLTPLPDYAELLVATHTLELPRDLGLKTKKMMVLFGSENDPLFDGFPDHERARFVGAPSLPYSGASPVTRLAFAHTSVRERAPLLAADRCFESWVNPLLPPLAVLSRRWQRRGAAILGVEEPVTVVAATRYLAASVWPTNRPDQEKLLSRELDASIEFLNDVVLSLGLIRNDPRLLPIARGDLPVACPVILEVVPMPTGRRLGKTFLYRIHGEDPLGFEERRDDAELAADLARSNHHGEQPFFLFYELMQRSIQGFNAGRFSQAILSLGTGIEVMIAVTVRLSSQLHCEPAQRAENILDGGLWNVVGQHLGRYANITVDLTDPSNPCGRWFLGGYKLRNRVAHEGHRPDIDETRNALDDAMAFIGEVRDGLRSQPTTKPVGEALQWGAIPVQQTP